MATKRQKALHILAITDGMPAETRRHFSTEAQYDAYLQQSIEDIVGRFHLEDDPFTDSDFSLAHKVNNAPNFGVTDNTLRAYMSQRPENFPDLQHIYYGLHNLDVPREVLSEMNTSEIIALYMGASLVKRKGKRVNSESFPVLISQLVGIGYQHSSVIHTQLVKKGYTGHSTNPGDLLKRMEKISDVSQARFMESFQSPRIYSTAESSYGKFIDPNCDSASKTLYKRAIASYLHYRFHTGEQLVPTSAYTLGHRFRVSNASITEYNVQSQPDHPIHTTRRIVLDDGPVMYRCDCPGYEQWQRCKHVVALKDIDQGQKHIQDRLF